MLILPGYSVDTCHLMLRGEYQASHDRNTSRHTTQHTQLVSRKPAVVSKKSKLGTHTPLFADPHPYSVLPLKVPLCATVLDRRNLVSCP